MKFTLPVHSQIQEFMSTLNHAQMKDFEPLMIEIAKHFERQLIEKLEQISELKPRSKVTKLTVNIANDNLAIVKDLASKQSTNMTTVINKAIQIEKFMQEAQERGEKILIEDRSGKVREVIFR